MLFAMLSFMYTGFLCVFSNTLMLNNFKVETDEIYFIVSFGYLFNDPKFANRYEQKQGKRLTGTQQPSAPKFWAGPLKLNV